MGKFFDSIKRSVQAAETGGGPIQYTLDGRTIICPLCEGDRFVLGHAQLNTAGMTLLGLDWANRSATTLACAECGRLEWFLQPPEPVE